MMGVYIKGMEMPSCCEKCPVNTKDAFGGIGCRVTGYIPLRKADQDFPNWCPLVPVPPHGRLIDGDVAEVIHFTEEGAAEKDFYDGILYAADWISNQPTVIPAEEGE